VDESDEDEDYYEEEETKGEVKNIVKKQSAPLAKQPS
jgi:hypothetical protein